jgi:hypothetical protein
MTVELHFQGSDLFQSEVELGILGRAVRGDPVGGRVVREVEKGSTGYGAPRFAEKGLQSESEGVQLFPVRRVTMDAGQPLSLPHLEGFLGELEGPPSTGPATVSKGRY